MWLNFLTAIKKGEHRVAPTTWLVGIVAIVYTISPIDLIPELFLGPLGFADDIGLWGILVGLVVREQRRWQGGLGPE
jgi:uncharacterized membrane protein YkvA (DUF1232 family)